MTRANWARAARIVQVVTVVGGGAAFVGIMILVIMVSFAAMDGSR